MSSDIGRGVIRIISAHSFLDTISRLESALASRGLTVFARIDFSGDAEKAGLKMNPTQLIVFGDPKSGTPIMAAAPSSAIDLPLKILVSEDANRLVWVAYNSSEYLRSRHNIPSDLMKNISGIASIVASVAGQNGT